MASMAECLTRADEADEKIARFVCQRVWVWLQMVDCWMPCVHIAFLPFFLYGKCAPAS